MIIAKTIDSNEQYIAVVQLVSRDIGQSPPKPDLVLERLNEVVEHGSIDRTDRLPYLVDAAITHYRPYEFGDVVCSHERRVYCSFSVRRKKVNGGYSSGVQSKSLLYSRQRGISSYVRALC